MASRVIASRVIASLESVLSVGASLESVLSVGASLDTVSRISTWRRVTLRVSASWVTASSVTTRTLLVGGGALAGGNIQRTLASIPGVMQT
ncbi:hypothetical protein [Pendulispora albinea]|uniref:Uncharacterized protein n=1 Tax=Pendulispora albinea TaxID=2741071 RepID=A0ABZ2M8F4_9BACT